MKRPLQLSLAIALALGGTNALALGLGPVQVHSKLNQPLDAEIPVIQGSADEAEGLLVGLAGAEEFERIGLSLSHLRVPLEFAVAKNASGAVVIKVTSKEPVRETYLDFLVEANWSKGRLLREYTVLLDPPLTAPTRATTASSTPSAPPATPARSTPAPAPARETAAAPAAPRPASRPAPAAPAKKAEAGEYGPIEAGETLSAIARATRPDEGTNLNQMMLALLKSNPGAFYKDNINALKRGAILRVPSADEIKAVGTAGAAAAAVQAQVEDWRGGKASPTLVADAGNAVPAPAATGAKPSKSGARDGERLELVPPKAGKDSLAMADRPGGAGAGSAAASSEIKSELARTREALTSREHETGELKSRVKELEDLKTKNDRLLSLKDSEIAELQQKLKQLQNAPAAPAKGAATPAPAPAVAAGPAASPAPAATPTAAPAATPIDKNDIWGKSGDDGARASGTADTAKPAAAPTAAVAHPAGPTPATTSPLADATPPTAEGAPAPASAAAITAPAPAQPAANPPGAAPKPPAKPPVKAKAAPVAAAEPWYAEPWVMPGALGAGVLLLLGGLLGLRKRKAAPAERSSIADAFGDSPLAGGDAGGLDTLDADEADLMGQLQDDPHNIGLHLELLSVYYAKRDVAKFEEQAQQMHASVADPHQPEWLEAQAMGQELAPHNPLFSAAAHYDEPDLDSPTARVDRVESASSFDDMSFDTTSSYEATSPFDASDAALFEAPAEEMPADRRDRAAPAELDSAFGLDSSAFGSLEPAVAAATPVASSNDGFDFGDLPPLEFETASSAEPEAVVVEPVAVQPDDDFFAGDDAIGTKLDLAKAYMDMGDPDGARSMLEEVLAEGNEAQQSEAKRLMADLR